MINVALPGLRYRVAMSHTRRQFFSFTKFRRAL
jgi:hypothetical protein